MRLSAPRLALLLLVAIAGGSVYYGLTYDRDWGGKAWRAHHLAFSNLDSRLKGLAEEIQAVQGEGACIGDSDCRTVGLGTRVCGEYGDFLVYSVRDVNQERLLPLVSKFNRLHEQASNLSLAANRCGSKPARIRCVRQRCVPEEG